MKYLGKYVMTFLDFKKKEFKETPRENSRLHKMSAQILTPKSNDGERMAVRNYK